MSSNFTVRGSVGTNNLYIFSIDGENIYYASMQDSQIVFRNYLNNNNFIAPLVFTPNYQKTTQGQVSVSLQDISNNKYLEINSILSLVDNLIYNNLYTSSNYNLVGSLFANVDYTKVGFENHSISLSKLQNSTPPAELFYSNPDPSQTVEQEVFSNLQFIPIELYISTGQLISLGNLKFYYWTNSNQVGIEYEYCQNYNVCSNCYSTSGIGGLECNVNTYRTEFNSEVPMFIYSGLQGQTGEQGFQGVQGIKGDKGDKGEKGIPGPSGIEGTNFSWTSPGSLTIIAVLLIITLIFITLLSTQFHPKDVRQMYIPSIGAGLLVSLLLLFIAMIFVKNN